MEPATVTRAAEPNAVAVRAPAREPEPHARDVADPVLRMQQSAGNRAVGRWLQAKSRVGGGGDAFEQEADRAADQVVTGTGPPLIQRKCACEEDEEIQRKAAPPGVLSMDTSAAPDFPPDRDQGQPLAATLRPFFEQRMGYDFGGVRIHTGAAAEASANRINALAYTRGRDIVFGSGQYAPGSTDGRRLIAHELAHVVQQSRGGTPPALDAGAQHEVHAHAAAAEVVSSDGAVEVRGATGTGCARNGPKYPALTADELMNQLVLANRGWSESTPGIPGFDPAAPGGPMGMGYHTYAAVQIIDREGNQIVTSMGAFLGRRVPAAAQQAAGALEQVLPPGAQVQLQSPHAEAEAVSALRANLKGVDLAGTKMMVVVDQVPCPGCSSALDQFAKEMGIKEIEIHVPSRPPAPSAAVPKPPPGATVSPKTAARTFAQVDRVPTARLLETRTFSGVPDASAAPATPVVKPVGEPAAAKGGATTPGETPGAAAEAAAAPATSQMRVGTTVRVLAAVQRKGGPLVSDVEFAFGQGLDKLNAAAPEGAKISPRIVLRITQGADGAVTAVEAVTGESPALAEALAQQLVRAGAGGEAGAAAGAEGATAGASRGMTLLFRGVKWGGWAVFAVVTGYQLIKATPAQRPRVVASAAGGLAGGVGTAYLVCNLALGIETMGWSLLICGLIAGGAGGYAGSELGGAAYDAATMTPVESALLELEQEPVNTRLLFYAMIANAGAGGLPISADFVYNFMSTVPSNLEEYEIYMLAGDFQPVGPGDTLDSVLSDLRRAIERLPGRAPRVLPPSLGVYDLYDYSHQPGISEMLFGPEHTGITFGPPAPGRVILFPGPGSQPRIGLPSDRATDVPGLLQIDILP